MFLPHLFFFFFFFNDTATTEIYTLSLHDALPICHQHGPHRARGRGLPRGGSPCRGAPARHPIAARSPLPPAAACVPTRRGESGGGRKSSPVRGLLQGGRDVQAPRGRYRGAGAAPPQPREAAPAAEGGEARGA